MELARVVINATGCGLRRWTRRSGCAQSGTHLVFDAAAFGNPDCRTDGSDPGETNRFVSPCRSNWVASTSA